MNKPENCETCNAKGEVWNPATKKWIICDDCSGEDNNPTYPDDLIDKDAVKFDQRRQNDWERRCDEFRNDNREL